MGFNKKIVGELQILEIEMNPENIKYYLNADAILFSSKEIEIKFKEYEKQYRPQRSSVKKT
jgi:hypothetical protein